MIFIALARARGFPIKGGCSPKLPNDCLPYKEGRGSQVVRQRSAKPLFASSILARASKISNTYITHCFLRAAVWLLIDGEAVFESAFSPLLRSILS